MLFDGHDAEGVESETGACCYYGVALSYKWTAVFEDKERKQTSCQPSTIEALGGEDVEFPAERAGALFGELRLDDPVRGDHLQRVREQFPDHY